MMSNSPSTGALSDKMFEHNAAVSFPYALAGVLFMYMCMLLLTIDAVLAFCKLITENNGKATREKEHYYAYGCYIQMDI